MYLNNGVPGRHFAQRLQVDRAPQGQGPLPNTQKSIWAVLCCAEQKTDTAADLTHQCLAGKLLLLCPVPCLQSVQVEKAQIEVSVAETQGMIAEMRKQEAELKEDCTRRA
jgi:hypothetical protein